MRAPNAARTRQRASFVPGSLGPLFEVRSMPEGADGAASLPAIVLVAPVGEEMNRSRRLLTRVRRALGAVGCHASLADPYGTGDSAGEFVEARWEVWTADLEAIVARLRDAGAASVTLVGLRSGALLVDAAAATIAPTADAVVMVQPETDGALFVRRALRARAAARRLQGLPAETVEALWARFEAGETIELGGYAMSPALALALRAASCAGAPPPSRHGAWWIEVSQQAAGHGDAERGPSAGPGAGTSAAVAPEAGAWCRRRVIARPFWQLHDAAVDPALVSAIVEACTGTGATVAPGAP